MDKINHKHGNSKENDEKNHINLFLIYKIFSIRLPCLLKKKNEKQKTVF